MSSGPNTSVNLAASSPSGPSSSKIDDSPDRSRALPTNGRGLLLAALAAVMALGAGCGESPDVQSASGLEAAESVVVVCADGETRVATPVVRVQEDGVHVRIRNETAAGLSLLLRQNGGGAGADAPRGVSELVTASVVPGDVHVACYDSDLADPSEVPVATFEVVDPEGLWISTDLDCESVVSVTSDFLAGTAGLTGTAVEAAHSGLAERNRLQPGDKLEAAGYPLAGLPVVRVVRSGLTVATVELQDDGGGGWLITTVTACDDAGIAEQR